MLFAALLLTPRKSWWVMIAAAFPAHVLAELHVGMAALPLLVAFATNCLLAILNAATLLRLSSEPWFGSTRKVSIYIIATAE